MSACVLPSYSPLPLQRVLAETFELIKALLDHVEAGKVPVRLQGSDVVRTQQAGTAGHHVEIERFCPPIGAEIPVDVGEIVRDRDPVQVVLAREPGPRLERPLEKRLRVRVQAETRIDVADGRFQPGLDERLVLQACLQLTGAPCQDLSCGQGSAARRARIGHLEEPDQKVRHLSGRRRLEVGAIAFGGNPSRLNRHHHRERRSRMTSVAIAATPAR